MTAGNAPRADVLSQEEDRVALLDIFERHTNRDICLLCPGHRQTAPACRKRAMN
jgi:hypothetical protein